MGECEGRLGVPRDYGKRAVSMLEFAKFCEKKKDGGVGGASLILYIFTYYCLLLLSLISSLLWRSAYIYIIILHTLL